MNALIYLAREWSKGPVLISTISNDEHIPLKFLEGILLELKKIGVLSTINKVLSTVLSAFVILSPAGRQ